MIINFDDVQKDMPEDRKLLLYSIIHQISGGNLHRDNVKIISHNLDESILVFNSEKHFWDEEWLNNFVFEGMFWKLATKDGDTYPLPHDLLIKKRKKTLIITNREIIKELLRLGFKHIYIPCDQDPTVFASKDEPAMVTDVFGHAVEWNSANNSNITLFTTNPDNIAWNESLIKLEDLL